MSSFENISEKKKIQAIKINQKKHNLQKFNWMLSFRGCTIWLAVRKIIFVHYPKTSLLFLYFSLQLDKHGKPQKKKMPKPQKHFKIK
jgi:hypothetical protein